MQFLVIAALAGAFAIQTFDSAHADAVLRNFFGTYAGIEPDAIVNGASFDESRTSLNLSDRGLLLRVHRDARGRDWKIHFPPDWIISHGLPCLGVRQAPVGHLAFALCLGEPAADGTQNVTMITPDGRSLGEYIRESGEDAGSVQWRLYDRFEALRPRPRGEPTAAEALRAVRDGDANARLETLRDIRRRMADRREDEIPGFVDVIALALRSDDVAVQLAAIDVVAKAARFTHAFEPLRQLVAHPADLHPDVLSMATRTLGGLVMEANTLFTRRAAYTRTFGSTDLDELYRRTGGIMRADAPDHEAALEIFRLHPGPSRAWTMELREKVLVTLDTLARRGPSAEARREAQRVIDVFGTQPMPKSEDCGNYFSNGIN